VLTADATLDTGQKWSGKLMQTQTFATVGQSIAWHAAHTPHQIAVVRQGGSVTYRRLARDLTRCVQALRERNVGPGTLVGLALTRRYTHLVIEIASELLGAAVTSVLTREDYIVPHCHVIFDDCARLAPSPTVVPLTPDWLAGLRPPAGDTPSLLERDIAPDQIVRIVRSSGTSGKPKAAVMSFATRQYRLRKALYRLADQIFPAPRLLCPYPLNIGLADVRVLGVLQHGGTVYLAAKEDVDGLIASGAVNYTMFWVGDLNALVERGVAPPAGGKVCIEAMGDTVPKPLRDRVRRIFNTLIWNIYATSETNVIAMIDDDHVGTIEPDMEVRLVDEQGNDVPPGEPGRIMARGATMVSGYFNEPELTRASFIDGWFRTSDLARMVAPGKLTLLGRADGVLNIAGMKFATAPIEERIRQIAGISDVALLRVGDNDEVGSLLVAVETAIPDVARVSELIRPALARMKVSYSVMTSPSFPRTRTGKVQRHAIEAEFNGHVADQVAASG
jgi:acyl-CoA synthetase (AMP-forming)/AMP-acid ligase II